MSKEYLNPAALFPSQQYGFSQLVTSPAGKLVFLSGQVGWDAEQTMVGKGDLRAQTWQALRNVEAAMQAAGGGLNDVVSLRIYIVAERLAESQHIQAALQTFFPAERAPAATWIGVPALANEAFLVEIEATAVIDDD
ncbi:MAG: RidA family protein [Candidatus Promineifilaceae bacterium]|nr:RidA family protein [Candidatus Promineifilaceae bacterium]